MSSIDFPFAAEGQAKRLEGRDEIAAYMRQLPGRITFGSFENIRVREIGDEVIMEADGHHPARGRHPAQRPLRLVHHAPRWPGVALSLLHGPAELVTPGE
jgi:hypothetical protein